MGLRPRKSRDVVVFLKFSDRVSYDLLRRKAGLKRWAPGKELGWAPLLPGSSQSGEKVTGIRVLRWSWFPLQVGNQGPCVSFPQVVKGV